MTMGWGSGVMPEKMSEKVLSCQEAADCLIPMGITSENVAEQYNISREAQDKFAAASYSKALNAQKDGKFRSEIVAVKVSLEGEELGRVILLLTGTRLCDGSSVDQGSRPQDWGGEGGHYRHGRWHPCRSHRRISLQDQARVQEGRIHPRW